MSSKAFPIYESFHSWQGEGVHLGRSAFFIRTFGCPVHCPWCDSAGTWHPDWIPETVERATAEDLAADARASKAEFAVITGGEPAIHDLAPLTTALQAEGLASHIETSGGFSLKGKFDWITVSPKWQKLPLIENVQRADEIKIIVENENSIEQWWTEIGSAVRAPHVWLHPEWSQRENPAVLNSITTWVKKRGGPFRVGYQLHRLFNADLLDHRVRQPAPLGGNPTLGY